ncbi:MAG: hypothetical protein MUE53_09075, partial [Chitinophagales bacterium]|nr:hypothetical protein [Chitinophagales bacterium]
MIRIILYLWVGLHFGMLSATHIVGGNIYYDYKGNGIYDIYFEIYRDKSSEVNFDGAPSPSPNSLLPDFTYSILPES